jgi:UDP-glucuronate decarboxylase
MNVDWSPLEGKSVLITGSTGFIGSHLVASLPLDSSCVWHCPSHAALESNIDNLPQVDYIIHAAGYAAPAIFTKYPIDTIEINTSTVIKLIQHLKPEGSFLFCSTSEIYKGIDHVATEDDIGTTNPQHERSAYIEGKRCGEAIIHAYRDRGIRAMSARISLAYGPGTKKHDARVLNQFIEQALTTGKIQTRDNCSAVPTYCYIDDTIEMLWNILLHGTQEVYNVGGIDTLPLSNLAKLIGKLTGAEVLIPESPEGIPFVKMDTSRYGREFDKRDFVTLRTGVSATIEYQRGLYDARTAG